MKWIEAKVFFESIHPQYDADLISNVFYEMKTNGVVVEEPDVEPEEGWGDDAIPTVQHHAISGYFPVNDLLEKRCKILKKKLSVLEQRNNIRCRLVFNQIKDEDWAHSWKKYFHPVKIGHRIVVKPSWEKYDSKTDEIVLEIDPGMAFGTGTHPTTKLCVRMLEKYLKPFDSFLDVGTGSGILMLAAEKLGASRIIGIDRDKTAVDVAGKNLNRNGIASYKFSLIIGNLVACIRGEFDIVAANILSEVIINLMDHIPEILSRKGIFICSGIIENNMAQITEKMTVRKWHIIDEKTNQGWGVIVAKPPTR